MRILLTRPGSRIESTARRLRQMGHDVIENPVLAIAPSGAPMPPGRFDAIIMTSPGSLLGFLPDVPAHLPVLAVGDRTAEDARQAGFLHVLSASGDRHDLAEMAREVMPPGSRLLLAAGRERKEDLVDLLKAAALEPVVWVCYHADAASSLTPDALAAIRDDALDCVLHYSPRSASLFMELAGAADVLPQAQALMHFCISRDTAAVLRRKGAARLLTASNPDDDAMIAAVAAVTEDAGL